MSETSLKMAFAERGYGVLATLDSHKPGDIIPGANIGDMDQSAQFVHPFYVVSETDRSDYEEQCRITGLDAYLYPQYKFFYRVNTD
jgi:hypothetical protein